jgi:bacillithiol biosynthesis deacetylase BshB1
MVDLPTDSPDRVPENPVTVVAVGAHPDDLEILCGGTLANLARAGVRVAILDITDGEPTPRGTPEQRKAEAEEARRALGVRWRFNAMLPNRVLMDEPANRMALATWFRKLKPEIVISIAGRTPSGSPDHYQAQLLVEGARFYSQLTKWDARFDGTEPHRIPHLVYAPFPFDAEDHGWHGSFVVDIAETWQEKLESVRAYRSQFDEARFARIEHVMLGQAAFHGSKCGFTHGERFFLPTPVGTRDFVATVTGNAGGLTVSKHAG